MNQRFLVRLFPLALGAMAIGLSSCQTYQVPITYADPATVIPGPKLVDLGRFVDARDEVSGTALGSIKNEVGIPIKTLTTRKPVAELVHNAVGFGLKARGMLVGSGQGRYVLSGTITEFYAHQLASQTAGCTIRFQVFRKGKPRPVFERTYRSQRKWRTAKVSYFGNVDELADVSSAAMQDVIDQALDDPELRRVLR
jgi:uncharacterized lipoprotein YajG